MGYLAEANEQGEDMSIIVQHSGGLDVGVKLRLTLSVEGLIEVLLPLIKAVLSQHYSPAPHSNRSQSVFNQGMK